MSVIKLDEVADILDRVLTSVEELNGSSFDDGDSVRQKRAVATRQLLVLADTLELASNLVRNEYWKTKGYDDMLGRR